MGEAVRERLRLLVTLRAAGPVALFAVVTLIVVASLVPAATAVTVGVLIDRVTGSPTDTLLALAVAPLVAFGVVLLVGHAVDAARGPLYYLVGARVDGAHRAAVARLAATSPTIGALERPDVQSLIREARADPDNWTERTPSAGALSLLGFLGRVLTLVSSGLVLAAYSWWLVPLLVVAATFVQQRNRNAGIRWYHAWRRGLPEGMRSWVWSSAVYSPAEGKELRIFGLAELAGERSASHLRAMYGPVWALGGRIMARGWQQFLLVLVPLSVAFLAVGLAAAHGRVSVGIATAVLSAGPAVYRAAATDPRDVIGGLACVRAFTQLRAELGGTATRPAGAAAAPAGPGPALVRFEGIGFTYPGAERRVLDGLDLEIRPGELLAIVGLNGAGKSTLIKLLAGLYEPTSGRITADGVDIAAIGPDAWRRRIAVVFQDFVRYHLSAADNVALGNASRPPDRAAIEAAARDAGFDAVLKRLPQGWETPLARSRTGGVDLSGGEWQQVVLARALYAVRTGARLLVLDEPTAHLDVRTEFDVFARLAEHSGGAGVVLISHRLSTVRQADRIVLLDDGRIAESGTHDELMAAGGQYAAMFAIQADRFNSGYDDRIEEGELI
jgi:ABC-type multidrug transport system fused ATPase/permease subunit